MAERKPIESRDTSAIADPIYRPAPVMAAPPFSSSPSLDKIIPALVSAQVELENPAKVGSNPFFDSNYATLEAILNHKLRVTLSKHGLVVLQPFTQEGDRVLVVTTIYHASGQWISSTIEVKSEKTGPQAVGSALTYYRRYSILGLLGLAPEEDDDGNAATNNMISNAQANRLYAIAKKNGWNESQILCAVQASGQESVERMHYQKYDAAIKYFETHKPDPTKGE